MNRQRVLVTAGAGGIGRAIARAFVAKGADVFVCDLDVAGLESLAREVASVKTAVCDMSSRDAIEAMVAVAVQTRGGLDVLINNAGISGPTAPTETLDPDEWERVLRVNLTGTFDVTRLAIPHLKQSPAGVIINISSAAGRFGYPNRVAYSTTKWGLIGFTKTLSMELGEDGIRVNAILPGAVDGARFQQVLAGRARQAEQTLDEATESALAKQSIKRLVDPAHIADLAVFLASESGRSISGQALPIDCDLQSN
jgi:NAD(P)-dependent dehydrogenase (short-subunit alcohol dehydrogenase family)